MVQFQPGLKLSSVTVLKICAITCAISARAFFRTELARECNLRGKDVKGQQRIRGKAFHPS